jgi:formamidopyrimidine-DNA glycosylase
MVGRELRGLHLKNPFLLRTVEPKVDALLGRRCQQVSRIGKRVVIEFEGDYFSVIHLMVAGRLHWLEPDAKVHKTRTMAVFDFGEGQLQLTEAGKKRRASLHLVRGRAGLAEHDPGGLELGTCAEATFLERFREGNHTLKRNLTDPRIFSGIGGAFADEILHRARCSPVALSQRLEPEDIARIYTAARDVLHEWTERLTREASDAFPRKVTAFRPEMAVHGKFGKPCPVCGDPVQRIVYAKRETNYCATCQTGGRVLADRALSRLLGKDWPRTLEELETKRRPRS